MDHGLRERPKPRLTCPLCREVLEHEADVATCGGCATAFHRECALELAGGTCPTLGCGESAGWGSTRDAPGADQLLARAPELMALVAAVPALAFIVLSNLKLFSAATFAACATGFLIAMAALLKRFVVVCGPNEAVVLSGMSHTNPGTGQTVGYRILLPDQPGVPSTAIRTPFLEVASRMDLRPLDVDVRALGVCFKGGERLDVNAKATVAVSRTPEVLINAIERFLGQDRTEFAQVAANTLEGHLRAACARAALEDEAAVEQTVRAEAPADLRLLGIELRSFVLESSAKSPAK